MKHQYRTQGTCSQGIEIELEGDRVGDVTFLGGCNGSLSAVAALVRGMTLDEAIAKLQGIRCGGKPTSCPDQLARALTAIRDRAS